MKVAHDDLYATKLVVTLSVDNPLIQPAALLPAVMMQLAQAARAPSLTAG